MMRLGAIIVTYNRLTALQTTLPRVLAEDLDDIWVIDNASTDDTQSWLNDQNDPRLKIIRLPQNTGGAGGFHAGTRAAQTVDIPPDWVVLFDDDAWPEPGCIAQFRSEPFADDVGVVSAAVTYPDGTLCEMNRQGHNPFWHPRLLLATLTQRNGARSGFKLQDKDLTPTAPPQDLDNASFVGFFLRVSAIKTAGLPDAGLFIYGDDVLYSLRLRRAGWRIQIMPKLRFSHDCATLDDGFVYRPLWKTYYHCRNGVEIARVAAGPVIFPLALAYYILVWWQRGRNCPASERPYYYQLMRMGLRHGLRRKRGYTSQAHDIAALASSHRNS